MYLITYIVDESGYEFLKRIGQKYVNKSFFEGKLFDEHIDLQLSEELTVFTIGIKYGWFIMEEEPKKRVKEFEYQILKLLEGFEFIYRVDESLIQTYWSEVLDDEFWHEKKGAFKSFSEWIEKQENLHWERISLQGYSGVT